MRTTLSNWRGRWAFAVAMALTVLAIAGLGAAQASTGASAQASGANEAVDINHFAFHPPTLTIAAGTKVAFVNSSGVTHTATRAGSFDTGQIKPGKSVAIRFTQKGTFAYHCKIHSFMHGKIVVK
ncbi:MAG: cupredoxin domain-containing protein [Solirubrobacterales bacterium]